VKFMEMQLSSEIMEISRYTLKIIGSIFSLIYVFIAYINYKKERKLSSKYIAYYFFFYFFFPGLAILNQAIPKANNVFIGAEMFFSILGNIALFFFSLELFSSEDYLNSKKIKIFFIFYLIFGFVGSFIISYVTFAVNAEEMSSISFGYVGVFILYILHFLSYIYLFFNMIWTARQIKKIGSIEYTDIQINNFIKRAYILASGCVFMVVMLIFMNLDIQVTDQRTIWNPISWFLFIIVISIFFLGFNSSRNENLEE